jgi:hypothetical protein
MSNFPPGIPQLTGVTNSILNATAAVSTTVMFTSPITGVWLLGIVVHIVQTDGSGTIAVTGVINNGLGGANLTAAPNLATGADSSSRMQPAWIKEGDSVTIAATVSGLTGTTYDLFVTAIRVL